MAICDLEQQFKNNKYKGAIEQPEYYRIIKGKGNTIVSTPHSCKHFRNQTVKSQEYMTGAIGLSVQEKTKCHIISLTKYEEKDANWDETSEYRDTLIKTIKDEQIEFLLDLHGMKDQSVDIEFGTNNLANIDNSNIFKQWVCSFWKNIGYRVRFDKKFKATRNTCISNHVHRETGIFCLQVEISSEIRSSVEKSQLFSDSLSSFIESLNSFFLLKRDDINSKNKKNESWWPLNYLIIPKDQWQRIEVPEYGLVSFDFEDFESGNNLQIIYAEDETQDGCHLSSSFHSKLEKLQGDSSSHNWWILRRLAHYPVKDIRKIDSSNISDNTIQVDSNLYAELHKKGIEYVKVINSRLGMSAIFNLSERADCPKHSRMWISQRNRSLLGIEIQKKYHWYEYIRILDILETIPDNPTETENLLTFFKQCYRLENNGKDYEQVVNAIEELNTFLQDKGRPCISEKDLRIAFKSLFPVIIVGSTIPNKVDRDPIADLLVGFSKQRFITGRIDEVLEGSNNVKINEMTASLIDVQNNERLIVYNGKKKKSCRVIIDDCVEDSVIQIPKRTRLFLDIYSERTLVNVKRDNWHIIRKNIESTILSIALTSFTVINFFSEFIRNKVITGIIVVGICVLIISSTFSERRKNVR